MIRLAVVLVTVSLSINLIASDQKQSRLSSFSNFSLLKALSLVPLAPAKKSFDPLAVMASAMWTIVEGYVGHNPHSFSNTPLHFSSSGSVLDTAWHPDGIRFAATRGSGGIKTWDRKTKERFTLPNSKSSLHVSLAFSHTGTLASIDDDNVIKIWSQTTNKPSCSWSTSGINPRYGNGDSLLLFDHEGTHILSANKRRVRHSGLIKIWDVKTQKVTSAARKRFYTAQLAWFDKNTLIACQFRDPEVREKTIRLYDVRTMEQVGSFPAYFNTDYKQQVARLDDKTLIYNNSDSLSAFDVRKNKCLNELCFSLKPKERKAIRSMNVDNERQVVILETRTASNLFVQQHSLEAHDLKVCLGSSSMSDSFINEITRENQDLHPLLSPCGTALLTTLNNEISNDDIFVWEKRSLVDALKD